MKLFHRIIFIFLFTVLGLPVLAPAQAGATVFSLKQKLKHLEMQPGYLHDTTFANTLTDLAYIYSYSYPDSALAILEGHAERCRAMDYGKGEATTYLIMGDAFQTKGVFLKALELYQQSLLLSKKIHYQQALPLILNRIGIIHLNQGNYPEALRKFYESLKTAELINDKDLIGATLNNIAIVHFYQGKLDDAERDYRQRLELAKATGDTSSMSLAYNGIGEVNLQQKDLANALRNLGTAYQLASMVNDEDMRLTITLSLAEAYYASDSLDKAASVFQNALLLSKQKDNGQLICSALIGLAKVYNRQHKPGNALANGLEALQRAVKMGQVQLMRDANEIVSSIYEDTGDGINALKYYRMYKVNSDSLNNLASQRAVAIEKAGYEFSKKEMTFQRKTLQQRWLTFSAFAALLSLAIVLWVIYRSRNRLNLTYKDLQHKSSVIEAQRIKAEQTLGKLKAAQSQLIQAEKMASLGQLTAGIAHEIQNPLNFVNNFSEVNKEMIAEMKEEIDKGNYDEVKTIADDISTNEEKINYHGKRADAIVKGMLQHSTQTKGVKESTKINALADEYLRLSYHGLRAKDKTFNARLRTHFDESIESIHIFPRDIGRVLLNLYTNAFYAVTEKKNTLVKPYAQQTVSTPIQPNYEPTVEVSTNKVIDASGTCWIEIKVTDNGNGIRHEILDKVFQPFFTTKPTGLGTGLGLSLSYDIINAHGGEIKVETVEGEGATFIITLPT